MCELRKINLEDAKHQWAYTAAQPADENGVTNPYAGVSWEEYSRRVLPELISYEHPVHMPDWFVPETYYYLWDGDALVGEFRLRHRLTEALRQGAGHVGYSVGKAYRGRGYGAKGMALLLEIAKQTVPEPEIHLRVRKSNLPSLRVLEKNGARVVGEDEAHLYLRVSK